MNPHTRIRFCVTDATPELMTGIEGVQIDKGYATIETSSPTSVLAVLTARASERGIELPELTVAHQTLEDAYLELVGEAEQTEAEA